MCFGTEKLGIQIIISIAMVKFLINRAVEFADCQTSTHKSRLCNSDGGLC